MQHVLGFRSSSKPKPCVMRKPRFFVPVSEDFLPAFACVAEAETLCSLYDALQSVFADGFETIFGKEAKFPAVTASLVLSSRDGNR